MTAVSIRSMPTLSPFFWCRFSAPKNISYFDPRTVTYWHAARTALWQSIRILQLKPGEILAAPAFTCGSELEPFVFAGMKIKCYGIGPDMQPDPASFAKACQGAAAALCTHYFGFAADLRPARIICDQQGIPLIEDCAHALYTDLGEQPVGGLGDVAVFSLWKTVALPDGGALKINRPDLQPPGATGVTPHENHTQSTLRSLMARHVRAYPFPPLRSALHLYSKVKGSLGRNGADRPDLDTEEGKYAVIRFRPEHHDLGMSPQARRIWRKTSPEAVRRGRRTNYRLLESAVDRAQSIRKLYPRLGDGTCPLFLPVVAEEPERFQAVLNEHHLGVKRIWTWFSPQVPWNLFPFEAMLKRTVFGLPVHQSLNPWELDRLQTVLSEQC